MIYACLGIPIRILSTKFSLFQQLYLWLFLATVFSIILFRKKIRFLKLAKMTAINIKITFFRAICYYVAGYFLWSFGIREGKYSNIAIINIIPTMAILGVILLKEKLNKVKLAAIFLSTIGATSVVFKNFSLDIELGVGELSALFSLIFFGLSQVARKWQTKALNNYESTTIILGIAGFANLILSSVLGEKLSFASWNWNLLAALISLALMNIVVLFSLNFAFEKIEIIVGSVVLDLEMAFGILVSVVLYKEIPTLREFIGAVLIVISTLLIRKDVYD